MGDLDGDGDVGIKGTPESRRKAAEKKAKADAQAKAKADFEAEKQAEADKEKQKKAAEWKIRQIDNKMIQFENNIALLQEKSGVLEKNAKAKAKNGDSTGARVLLKQQAQVQQQIKRVAQTKAALFNQKNQIQTAMLNSEIVDMTKGVGGLLDGFNNVDGAAESIQKVQEAQMQNDKLCKLFEQADGLEEFETDDIEEKLKAMALEG